jgi:hypothetical protein
MAEGGRVMVTDDRITPFTGQLTMSEGQAAVFRSHYEQQRRGYMTAATSMLYGTPHVLMPAVPVLPYHYDVLTSARDFLDAGMDDIAVIMAQTACEIATEHVISRLLGHHKLPPIFEPWVKAGVRRSDIADDRVLTLYRTLSDDQGITREPFWQPYRKHVEARNGVVHQGKHVSKEQAQESYDVALKLIHHFEAVLGRVKAAASEEQP